MSKYIVFNSVHLNDIPDRGWAVRWEGTKGLTTLWCETEVSAKFTFNRDIEPLCEIVPYDGKDYECRSGDLYKKVYMIVPRHYHYNNALKRVEDE